MKSFLEAARHPKDKKSFSDLTNSKLVQFLWKYYSKYFANDINMEKLVRTEGLEVSEGSYPKYYEMLKVICERFNMQMPRLFLIPISSGVESFASDKNQYILLNMFKYTKDYHVETELVRQCFNLLITSAEWRTLSKTMLSILSDAKEFPFNIIGKILNILTADGMRANELTLDRGAMLYYGSTRELHAYLLCGNKLLISEISDDEYNKMKNEILESQDEIKKFAANPGVHKVLSESGLQSKNKPMRSVRSVEAEKWALTDEYEKLKCCFNTPDKAEEWPLPVSSEKAKKENPEELKELFKEFGFTNVICEEVDNNEKKHDVSKTVSVSIDGADSFDEYQWTNKNAKIVIKYR